MSTEYHNWSLFMLYYLILFLLPCYLFHSRILDVQQGSHRCTHFHYQMANKFHHSGMATENKYLTERRMTVNHIIMMQLWMYLVREHGYWQVNEGNTQARQTKQLFLVMCVTTFKDYVLDLSNTTALMSVYIFWITVNNLLFTWHKGVLHVVNFTYFAHFSSKPRCTSTTIASPFSLTCWSM